MRPRSLFAKPTPAVPPGLNGISFKLYKNCPTVLEQLVCLIQRAWREGCVAQEWCLYDGTILLEGAPFPSLSPQCQRQNFLWSNHQANDIIPLPEQVHHHVSPEGWHPRVSWLPEACSNLEFVDDCKAREERSARHMAWPGECLWICTSQLHQVCFEVLPHLNAVADILMQYFGNVFMPFATTNYMKGWQALEVSIMMGCIVSPLPFVMCMELILWGTTTTTGGEETRSGGALPPSSTFMDDVTTLIQSKVGTQELLNRFHMGPDEGQTKEEPT